MPHVPSTTGSAAPAVLEALSTVIDPCCKEKGISVLEMGLVDAIHLDEDGARVVLNLTSGWCPFAVDLLAEIEQAVASVLPAEDVHVEISWDKAWSVDRLSPGARKKLRFLPPPRAVTSPAEYIATVTKASTAKDA